MSRQRKKTEQPIRRLLPRGSKPDPAVWMYAGLQQDLEIGSVACLVRGAIHAREEHLVPLGVLAELTDAIQIPWELRESWERITR